MTTSALPREWITPTEIAADLGVARSTVHRAIARGDLRALRYGSLLRVRRSDYERFLTTHQS